MGRLVENAVGAHLLNHLPQSRFAVHYWRVNDDEVDFVVEQGTTVWGVEVKSGRARRTPCLPAFRRRYPDSRVLIVGGEGTALELFFGSSPEAIFAALINPGLIYALLRAAA